MLAIPTASCASDVDRRFLLDGAYRSHSSLSLAERSEYGLRAPLGRFERTMNQVLAANARAQGPNAFDIPQEARKLGSHRGASEAFRLRSSAKSHTPRLKLTRLRPTMAYAASAAGTFRFKRPGGHDGAPDAGPKRSDLRDARPGVRFRVRVGGRMLLGIVHRGRLIVARHIDEERDGTFKSD